MSKNKPNTLTITLAFLVLLTALASVNASWAGVKAKDVPVLQDAGVTIVDGNLLANVTAGRLHTTVGGTFPIPHLHDASLMVAPAMTGDGTIFMFSVPLSSLLANGGTYHAVAGLPDGRFLPEVVEGVLPRWDFSVRDYPLSLYLAQDVFGIFVPLDVLTKKGMPIPLLLTRSIEDERGNLVGRIYAIPNDSFGRGSGLLILLPYLGGNAATSRLN